MRRAIRSGGVLAALVSLLVIGVNAQTARPSALIDSAKLLSPLKILSPDDMEGRLVDSPGGAKARAFVLERFKVSGIQPFGDSYLEPFTFAGRGAGAAERHGINVIGHIDGTVNPKRYIVVSAHYDHIGVRNGAVFNGADDNASGTAALFALAKYFTAHRPANSLIFAAFDGEESGERGSLAFVKTPPVDVASIIVDVNMDMIGRDPDPKLFAVGTAANPVLKPFVEEVIPKAPVKFLLGHETPGGRRNSPDEDWSGDSDHHSFQLSKIPAVYLGVEDFAQHHQSTDKCETMSFDFYVGATETSLMVVESFDKHLDEIAKVRAASAGGGALGPSSIVHMEHTSMNVGGTVREALPLATFQAFSEQPATLVTPTGALAGTLFASAPESGKTPVALIIAGSGPTDRDGNSAALPGKSNTYRMLAAALANQGIASLRYDKRAIAGSAAAGPQEIDLRFDMYVNDAAAWVAWLRKDPRFSTITVIGHSEGSLIGMLAAKKAGANAFVSLEGPARNATDILHAQLDPQLEKAPDLLKANTAILDSLRAGQFVTSIPPLPLFASLYRATVQPYLISWFKYTPSVEIAKLTIPVLIIQGTTDIQVGVDEANGLKAAKPDAELKIIDGMNHVLKAAPADRDANIAAYSDPSLPIVPAVPQTIVAFIQRLK